jgi:hypothetical protein
MKGQEITTILAGCRSDGSPVYEEVVVTLTEGGDFKLLQSPGLALGVAAEDVIRIREDRSFDVLQRGGNLCVQVYPKDSDVEGLLVEQLASLNGRLDGRSEGQLLVFTVPVSVGFVTVERVLSVVVDRFPRTEWYYGNVYDPTDGTTPLNWW